MTFPNTRTPSSVLPGAIVGDFVYFDDFIDGGGFVAATGPKVATTANVGTWHLTELGGATTTMIVQDDEPGGVVVISDAGSTNHGSNLQMNGAAFSVAAGRDLYWEMRWKPGHATQLDFVIGLLNAGVTAAIAGTVTQALVFRSGAVDTSPDNAGTADIIASAGDDITSWTHANITEVDTGVNMVADTFVKTAIWLRTSGSQRRAIFYVNGKEILNTTSNIPDVGTALSPLIARQNNGGAADMEVDYVYCAQTRAA